MDEKQERKGFYSREEVAAILKDFQEKNYQSMAKSTGNGAKMREALEAVLCNWTEDGFGFIKETTIEAVKQALAEPPRNCDVGTAEEQRARYNRFCRQHAPCDNGNCPLRVTCDCILTWAQMPYKEGGAK